MNGLNEDAPGRGEMLSEWSRGKNGNGGRSSAGDLERGKTQKKE